jgi:hypothetical protein
LKVLKTERGSEKSSYQEKFGLKSPTTNEKARTKKVAIKIKQPF